jgi:dinuclear metal center YbgI/SA1388 family protein
MEIKEIINALEKWAPPSLQEGYDNSGLITGSPDWLCTGILISLDCTEAVVDEAIEHKMNCIVAHHPIVFKGLKKITGSDYVQRTIIKAIKNDIAIYAIHTNLDNVHSGVNAKIAQLLGIGNPRILLPKSETLLKLETFVPRAGATKVLQAMYDAGAGHIGAYDHCSFTTDGIGNFRPLAGANPAIGVVGIDESVEERKLEVILEKYKEKAVVNALRKSHPYEEVAFYITAITNTNQYIGSGMVGQLEKPINSEEFLGIIKYKMNVPMIKHTALIKDKIQTVAVCGGAGSFLVNAAKNSGADIFITADMKYHEYFDADNQIIIADIGHYESEAYTKELIFDFLKEIFANIALRLSDVFTNPIKYF